MCHPSLFFLPQTQSNASRQDGDSISLSSANMDRNANRFDDYVELTVHGIEEAGWPMVLFLNGIFQIV